MAHPHRFRYFQIPGALQGVLYRTSGFIHQLIGADSLVWYGKLMCPIAPWKVASAPLIYPKL